MNTENLTIGQTFKNYPEICNFIGEEQKGGNSKKLQHKEWSRYIEYRREGHKYIIEKIYDEPKEKTDGRKRSNSNNEVYGELLEILLLHRLSTKKLEKKSLFQVYNELGITNMNSMNYRDLVKGIEDRSKRKIDKNVTKEFYSFSRIAFGSALISVLNSLVNLGIVQYAIKNIAVYNLFGNKQIREATDVEVQTEKEIRQRIMSEMGYRKETCIYWADRLNEFRNRVQLILKKEVGIDYIYQGYDIEFIQGLNDDKYCDVAVYLCEIKELFADRFMENASKRQKRLQDKYYEPPDITIGTYSYRVKESYLQDYKLLTDYFFKKMTQ